MNSYCFLAINNDIYEFIFASRCLIGFNHFISNKVHHIISVQISNNIHQT